MHSHHRVEFMPHTPEQLFALVADVARYQEFLPWCKASRVVAREEKSFLGELVISYKGFSESYTSRVTLTPTSAIDVVQVKGPFLHLSNMWRFSPAPGGTDVDFKLDFSFRSKVLDKIMGGFFARATEKMVDAFKARADELYGKRLTES